MRNFARLSAIVASVSVLSLTAPVWAADPTILEARIRALEKKIDELEAKEAAQQSSAKPVAQKPDPKTSNPKTNAPAKTAQGQPVSGLNPTSSEPKGEETSDQKAKPAKSETAPPTENPTSLQSAFLFSDKAPTLDKNKLEVSVEGSYTRATGPLQKDRVFSGLASVRYGVAEGWELSAVVPYYTSVRETAIPGNFIYGHADSIGDIGLQVTKQLWNPGKTYPGAALVVGVSLPTGESPFEFTSNYPQGGDPRKFLENVQSRGLWGANTNLQFYQLFDPIIVFFGIGLDKGFATNISGHEVDPALKYLYNAGISMALSEHTTFGFQVSGGIEGSLVVDGGKVGPKDSEQIRSRFVLIQRIADQLYLEPSVSTGLTRDSPDVALGLGLRKRF